MTTSELAPRTLVMRRISFFFLGAVLACSGRLDVGSNQSVGVEPTQKVGQRSCLGPGGTRTIVKLEDADVIGGLVVERDTLWVGTKELLKIDLPSGVTTPVPLVGFWATSPFVAFGEKVAYSRREGVGFSTLVLHDTASGEERALRGSGNGYNVTMVAAQRSGLLWATESAQSPGLSTVYHLGSAERRLAVAEGARILQPPPITSDTGFLYIVKRSPTAARIEAVPLAGGDARLVKGGFDPHATFVFAPVVDGGLVYAVGTVDEHAPQFRGALRRIGITGTGERTVVDAITIDWFLFTHGLQFDGTYFWWPEDIVNGVLARVPAAGGPPERIEVGSPITTFAVDDCNLYYATYQPPTVVARSLR